MERAKALHRVGHFDDAKIAYEEALARAPANFEAIHNLGILALQRGSPAEAIPLLRRAAELQPRHAQALANLGTAYLLSNLLEEALAAYAIALDLAPQLAGGWRNRGTILQRLGRYQEAADAFQRCQALAPGFDFALGSMFECRRFACDWREFEENTHQVVSGVTSGRNADRPFSFLSVSGSAERQKQCARLHAAYMCPRAVPAEWRGERYHHDKIRVAYVSADYRAHVVMKLLTPILELHDPQRFEIIGVSLVGEDDSDILRRAKRALSLYVDVSDMSDFDAAKTIRALETDIVVDLTGYTAGCRPGIFARRPAPVHVNYLGYIGTSGGPYMDYVIADRVAVPEDREMFFSERIVRLPHCFMPPGDQESIADNTPTRAELGLPDDAFVFCVFNAPYKFNPTLFAAWMRLLNAVPEGVLWLRDGPDVMREHLRREAAARGVEPTRLIFAGKIPAMRDYLAQHRQADLFLDTHPFGAHATARDALWAGLPVLTCLGDSFASRVAASMLTTLKLGELVTGNLPEYECRAAQLARDRAWLSTLRGRLAANLRDGPLFNASLYCRHLESAFVRMQHIVRQGAKPMSFEAALDYVLGAEDGRTTPESPR